MLLLVFCAVLVLASGVYPRRESLRFVHLFHLQLLVSAEQLLPVLKLLQVEHLSMEALELLPAYLVVVVMAKLLLASPQLVQEV